MADDVEEQLLSEVQKKDGTITLHQAAQKGEIKLVNDCLVDVHINVRDKYSRTPIMYAAWTDEIEMVKHLLNLGSDINLMDNSGWNILHHAVQKDSMRTVEYLCVEIPTNAATSLVNAKDPHGMTPLHMAIKRGSSKELILNLFKIVGIDVEIKNSTGKTALMYALEVNRIDMIDIVNIVCQHKNVFLEKDDYGLNISHYAVMNHKSLELIKCLLRNGSINNASLVISKDNIMVTPFHLATSRGSVELVLFLLKIDEVDVNVNDNSGETALMHATKVGKTNVIKALIADDRVEVNYCDKAGRTALMHATKAGKTDVIKALIADDRVEVNHCDKAGRTALMHATKTGKTDVIKALIADDRVDVNFCDKAGRTALMYAAKAGQTEVIKALTTADDRVEVNYRDKAGRTALMYAAEAGQTEAVQVLTTDDRVDVNYRDKFGKTALIYAAEAGQFKVIKALKTVDRVEFNHCDKAGKTAVMYAGEARQIEVIKALTTDDQVKVNHRDKFERTSLMHAAKAGQTKVIKALAISDQVEVNHRDKAGRTALMYAAEAGQIEVIKALTTDDRVKVNHRDKVGMTAVMYAAKAGQTEVIKALLTDNRVEVNYQDKYKKTALIYAAKAGQTEVIKALITDGRVDVKAVNHCDKAERTAFMYAAKEGKIEVIKALTTDDRVEVNHRDKTGKNALMYAAEAGQTEIIKALIADEQVEVNHRDKSGRTALLLAMKEKQFEAACILVDNVEKLVCSIGDNSGSTPLILALEANHRHLIHAVVNKININNEDVNLANAKGATILHTGVSKNDIELVKLICQNPHVKNVKNIEGLTPIDIAVKEKLYPMLWILVQDLPPEEIDINKSYEEGDTLLHFAVKQGNLDAARCICSLPGVKRRENDSSVDPLQLANSENLSLHFLLCIYKLPGTKVDINAQYQGKGIIHIAAELRDLEECNYLLNEFSNIDVNARDSEDRTALHIAAANTDVDTAKALCKFPSIKINLGSPLLGSPLLEATQHRNVDVALYLLSLPTIDLDIKDSAGNNIFEIVCDLIERSSSASIISKGSSKPSIRLVKAIEAVLCEVDHNSTKENTESDGSLHKSQKEKIPETLRFLLEVKFKTHKNQSILALLQDKIKVLSSSDDKQDVVKFTIASAVLNVIIVGLQKYAHDDDLRYTFYKYFMCKPLVKIFVNKQEITKSDHTATIEVMKLVYVSLQANADCQKSEKEFLRNILQGQLYPVFKRTIKSLGKTVDSGEKCSDIQLMAKNIYETYFKKDKEYSVSTRVEKFFKGREIWMAKKLGLHECSERGVTTLLFTIPGAITHLFDFALDVKLGVESLQGFSQRLGGFMIALASFTLIHENYRSSVELYKAEKERLRVSLGRFAIKEEDWIVESSLNYSKPCLKKFFQRLFCPFKMKDGEKKRALLFNILTICQMRPVIDRLMVLMHSPSKIRTVIRQNSAQKVLNQSFMVTEQIPELIVQFYLFQIYLNNIATESLSPKDDRTADYASQNLANITAVCFGKLQTFTYKYEFFQGQKNFLGIQTSAPWYLIISMIIPFLKMPASTVSLEGAFRKLDPLTPKMSGGASTLLYLTYLTMIPSRLFLHASLMQATPNHFYNVGWILFFTLIWSIINLMVISKDPVFKEKQLSPTSKVRKVFLLFLFSFRDFWVISLRDTTAYMSKPSEVSYKSLRSYKRIMLISTFYFVEGLAGALYMEHFFPCGTNSDVFKYQGWAWLILYIISSTCLILLAYTLQPQICNRIPKRFPFKFVFICGFGLIMLLFAPTTKLFIDGDLAIKIAVAIMLALVCIVCILVYLGLTYFGEAEDKKKAACDGGEDGRDSDSFEKEAGPQILSGEGEASKRLLDTSV
ncbi:uncharacterized protein LOC134811121 [Bolinopsis microptera]|uniref:uncharacterized protein LOC134811121 n=1 Tax=Bolinopsis microptera TaxID=2820187 RepID=UPI00307A65C5